MAQQQQQQALHAAGGNMYVGVNVTCARTGPSMGAIGGMHQMHQRLGYPRTNNQRPPNVNVGPPETLANSIAGRGAQQEWRHLLMQQQQGFQAQMRPPFNQQSHQGESRFVHSSAPASFMKSFGPLSHTKRANCKFYIEP